MASHQSSTISNCFKHAQFTTNNVIDAVNSDDSIKGVDGDDDHQVDENGGGL